MWKLLSSLLAEGVGEEYVNIIKHKKEQAIKPAPFCVKIVFVRFSKKILKNS